MFGESEKDTFSKVSCIDGLTYVPNFVNSIEENKLINIINDSAWLTDLKRRVQHYGYKYDYKAKSIDYTMYLGELPGWALEIAERIYRKNLVGVIPDQLIINEYEPGQGIANHVDCEPCFGDTIISLSLGSGCIMDLINVKSREKIEFFLEPGSIIVLSGKARYEWTHGIAGRKYDILNGFKKQRELRISMTFRNVILKQE
ncbi:alpha-ketoglutarate-dependent dioxygenase AlkB [Flavobacterium reichenbachii]|uniref:DNA repair protein n=2 Tax=Flavobacterium reichenbachii TaxID=362418 RepID=A0A085ZFQ9_9FLAO|nr:DNA repair protein [Flavobacterium reichenbachii]OXB15311.1 alpha-ketoglutarate-dependent dioxygenase AlkB [Flavobacterium reichenbachii]